MDTRKQYAAKVVETIIHFMAMAEAGILSKEAAMEMMDQIPEEFHSKIVAALMSARAAKKIGMLAKLASIFPIEEELEKATEEAPCLTIGSGPKL